MLNYNLTLEDFTKAVDFSVHYYLDPSKSPAGRTSAEPRGLGAVMDAFILGKLTEIGVQKILERINKKKQYILDFDIKSTSKVKDEPDIIEIIENGKKRLPNLFVEIKNLSSNKRWIGLTHEQLETMKKGGRGKEIIILHASISSKSGSNNPKITDLLGMYLKSIISTPIFNYFENLNAEVKLEYIFTSEDLESYGTPFLRGELFYETDLFLPSKIRKKDGSLLKNISFSKKYKNFNGKISIPRTNGSIDKKVGIFNINGSFETFIKINPKSQRNFIYCLEDTMIFNDVFGNYNLKAKQCYKFNLETVGRDPKLKRNNLWFSRNKINELINKGKIENQINFLKKVAEKI